MFALVIGHREISCKIISSISFHHSDDIVHLRCFESFLRITSVNKSVNNFFLELVLFPFFSQLNGERCLSYHVDPWKTFQSGIMAIKV